MFESEIKSQKRKASILYLCRLMIFMTENRSYGWFEWIALFVIAFIWGSSFILMKIGLKTFNSFHVAVFRVSLSTLVLLPFSIRTFRRISLKEVRSFLVVGLLGIFIPAMLFTYAQRVINSSVAGMLNSLTPLSTMIVGYFFYQTSLSRNLIAGVLIGLVGAVLILLSSGEGQFGMFSWYTLLIISATLCYGISTNETKINLSKYSGIEITSVSVVLLVPVLIPVLVFSDYSNYSVDALFWKSAIAIVILSLAGTTLALIIFNGLVKRTSAVFAASVTYIIPGFAILWGIFDGEKISIWSLAGILFVLYGIYIINHRK